MEKSNSRVSPLLSCGLLQKCYFLDHANKKHVRVGFFQTQFHGLYSLLVRFYSRDVCLSLEYDDYASLLIHQPSVTECLRRGGKLSIYVSDNLSILCAAGKVLLRSKNSTVGVSLSQAEWNTLELYTPAVQHGLLHLHLNSKTYLSFIEEIVKTGEFVNPPLGLSPYLCERLYYEVTHNGYFATA